MAVKTGTRQGYRDAWATAFSDRLLVVVWVGNHDYRRMNLASGATAAAPALHRIMDEVMSRWNTSQPVATSFAVPPTAVPLEVCALSGKLPGRTCTHVKTEYFIPGTEPTTTCAFHAEVVLDVRNGLRARSTCPARFVVKKSMLDLPETYSLWARRQHLTIAPVAESELCAPQGAPGPHTVAIREPQHHAHFLFDPDTPREYGTVRFSAAVKPANEEVVWLVDGTPVARVGWPHELRWSLSPGAHSIRAVLAQSGQQSAPVTVIVDD